jgi:hypothetical protein
VPLAAVFFTQLQPTPFLIHISTNGIYSLYLMLRMPYYKTQIWPLFFTRFNPRLKNKKFSKKQISGLYKRKHAKVCKWSA